MVFLQVMSMVCLRKLRSVCKVTRRRIPEKVNHKRGLCPSTRDAQKKYAVAVEIFKIHFRQNSSLVQIHTSASHRKFVTNIS